MNLPKKYISIDVETTGPYPPKYSMISLGACVIGEYDKTFYGELKPLNFNYIPEYTKVALSRIESLKDFVCSEERKEDYDFLALVHMNSFARFQSHMLRDFSDWLIQVGQGHELVEVSWPIKFDGSFTNYYFHEFLGENPFGHGGLDIQSFYRGKLNDLHAKLSGLMPTLPHHALEDALLQAKVIEPFLREADKESFR